MASLQTKPAIPSAPTGDAPSIVAMVTRVLTPSQWGAVALVGVPFLALFWEWIFRQHRMSWDKLDDWGHAYAIPFISMYMLFAARREILAAPRRTFWPAFPAMLLGIAAYVFFIVGVSNHMLQGFSLILVLGSLLLFLLGPRAFRFAFIPVAFLVFAITISEQIMIKLTFPLQLVASQGAYWLMSAVGTVWSSMASTDFLVTLKGNTLIVDFKGETHPLNVAEACSGMRMVIAFLALAAAAGLFGCRHWWQRTALLVLATPVAVVLNVFRVALLGFATLYDPGLATGDAHMIIGTLLLVPGLGAFMGLVWALNRCVAEDQPAAAQKGSGSKANPAKASGAKASGANASGAKASPKKPASAASGTSAAAAKPASATPTPATNSSSAASGVSASDAQRGTTGGTP